MIEMYRIINTVMCKIITNKQYSDVTLKFNITPAAITHHVSSSYVRGASLTATRVVQEEEQL